MSDIVIEGEGATLTSSSGGRLSMPTSPVVNVAAILFGSAESRLQHRDVTIVVVSKACRVPMWVSCGWRAEDEAEPGEEAERVVEVEVAEGGVRIYVAIEPVDVAAASMDG